MVFRVVAVRKSIVHGTTDSRCPTGRACPICPNCRTGKLSFDVTPKKGLASWPARSSHPRPKSLLRCRILSGQLLHERNVLAMNLVELLYQVGAASNRGDGVELLFLAALNHRLAVL